MNKEYIEREAVIAIFGDIHPMDYTTQAYNIQVRSLPAADVRENIRGRWETDEIEVGGINGGVATAKILRCSVCGNCSEWWTNFCPDCGADMRGKKDV